MANTMTCLQYGCEQPPVVNVSVRYPAHLHRDEPKDSRASYCLDHVAERVYAMLAVGEAVYVAIERVDSSVVAA